MQQALPSTRAQGTEGTGTALEEAGALYRQMVRLRILSARMVDLQREGAVAYHASCVGEEAAIVAATLAARDRDWIFPGAREWGAAIVRGLPLADYVHHAFGTAESRAKGHAPPDHVPARSRRVALASGVVGAHVPQAVGFAWAAKTRREDLVTVALFGEGATSTGDFHNAMNFAGVFKAPAVLVCRNNGRAAGTPAARQTKSASFDEKALAYGVAHAKADGGDALAVLALVREAVARAVEGRGPTLLELVTQPPEAPLGDGAWARPDVLALGDGDPLVRLRRALFGEGATSTGDFHNAMNFAGVFKAPAVLVCRNNGRAAGTPAARQTKSASFDEKALAYGVAHAKADGGDALAVLALVREAVARAVEGRGPTLLELVTQPPEAPLGDGAWARPDVLALGDGDPLVRLRRALERDGRLDASAIDALAAATREDVEAAVAAARRAPPPAPSTIVEDVYADVPTHLAESMKEAATWRR